MRNKIDLKKSWFCLFLCLFCFVSCEQELDKYYDPPGWLKGNAKQLLENRGNFKIFLEAIELTGYSDMISGKGIKTILAPTDEAFTKWLSENNYSSIRNVPIKDLDKLITFHLVYYSYDKSTFANYRPNGIYNETEEVINQTAGLYYKFRTHSRDSISTVNDPTVPSGDPDVDRKVYHYDRFVPVFSSYLFQTKGIDPVYNYQYFYPENTWTGQNGGFCISNSSVTEYEIVTDNGYVYVLDKVLTPLETIYKELNNSPNYSVFLKMYDRFISFEKDATATEQYGNGEDLYQSEYSGVLPPIGWEWPINQYDQLATLARAAYNVFAPSNASMENFFNTFWKDYYTSLNEVPFIPLKYLLWNHVYYGGDVVFPEEITSGKISTNFGTPINFDPQNTDLRKMCANGTLYGLNSLMVPRMFESVTAPALKNPEYAPFLLMMDGSDNLIPALMSENVNLSLFIPNSHVLIDNTSIDGSALSYVNSNPNKYGSEDIMYESENGPMSLSLGRRARIANNHVGTLVSSVGTNKIYSTLNSFQYLYFDEAQGKIYSSDIYNNLSGWAPSVKKIADAYNGTSYELHGNEGMALLPDDVSYRMRAISNPPANATMFRDLFVQAKFNQTTPAFNFLMDRFILLMPIDDAVEEGEIMGQIPTDPAGLEQFLKYHFINVNTSNLSGYVFPGAGIQGEMSTFCNVNREPAKLTVIDTGNKIQIKDAKGNVVNVVSVFPNIYNDGAVYLIDGVLEFE